MLENILIIQNDVAYQELWDLARLIACRQNSNQMPDLVQRRVVFRPYMIDNLEVISVFNYSLLAVVTIFDYIAFLQSANTRYQLWMRWEIEKSTYGWTSRWECFLTLKLSNDLLK